MSQTWTEHETCARCGDALGEQFATNHLGVRFCPTCYKEAVEVREHERLPNPALEQLCNRCHGSLINGYQANYLGVHFCVPCFERTHNPDGRPVAGAAEAEMTPPRSGRDRDDDSDPAWSSMEEEEGFYLHDVFFVTTIFALILYAVVRFGGALLTMGGY